MHTLWDVGLVATKSMRLYVRVKLFFIHVLFMMLDDILIQNRAKS